jgi:hypothetical protein
MCEQPLGVMGCSRTTATRHYIGLGTRSFALAYDRGNVVVHLIVIAERTHSKRSCARCVRLHAVPHVASIPWHIRARTMLIEY